MTPVSHRKNDGYLNRVAAAAGTAVSAQSQRMPMRSEGIFRCRRNACASVTTFGSPSLRRHSSTNARISTVRSFTALRRFASHIMNVMKLPNTTMIHCAGIFAVNSSA